MKEALSAVVYRKIQQDIDTGIIPDKSFFSEQDLAQRYGVSKTTIKNAIHRLCQEGYIIGYPRKGYMINSITPEEFAKISIVREQLEQLALNLAITEATEDDICALRKIVDGSREVLDPVETSNTAFHLQLAKASHNEYIVELLPRLLIMVSRVGIKSRKQFDPDSHRKIVDALEKRDWEKAREYLKEDLQEKFW